MHIMEDGRVYTSDYCMRHPHLDASFKGIKKDTSGMYTPEYRKHMASIMLVPLSVEVDGVTKKYQECPKCHSRYSEKK